MAETASYPFFGALTKGCVHVRAASADLSQSFVADTAACAVSLVDVGFDVTVSAWSNQNNFVETSGLGWNHPALTVTSSRTLLELTAQLFEVWDYQPGSPAAFVVPDWVRMSTGPGSGHDDDVAATWLRSASTGNVAELENLTGLSFQGYTHNPVPAKVAKPTFVVGTWFRRSKNGPSLSKVMGGGSLAQVADTVVGLTNVDLSGDIVSGVATVLLHRDHPPRTVNIVRPLDANGPWVED